MIIKNKNNRLGIFVFFDKEGIVDDYVLYLLDDLKKSLKDLIIMVNGKILQKEKDKLKKYSKTIYERKNIGYDVSAWKEVLLKKCDKKYLESFGEIVLFNDTFYGPFYSFTNVFDVMNKRDIDLWGLTAHGEAVGWDEFGKCRTIPKFIQSYFYVFRKSLVSNDIFYEYWNSLPDANDIEYNDAVAIHENNFADYFEKQGFKTDAYIDNSELSTDPETSICYNTFMPYGMIKDRNLPIIRRKVFNFNYYDTINFTGNEEVKLALDYIKNNTNYPIKLIWDNLLRLYNIANLKNNLHLNYVIDDEYSDYVIKNNKTAAVFVHLYYTDILSDSYDYLKNIPNDVDLYISTGSEEKKEIIKTTFKDLNIKEIRVIKNRGRDLASLLVGFRETIKKYKYFCFIHDKKTSGGKGPLTIGRSFQYIEFDNLLKSESYIKNIIKTFDENPSMGILSPPVPLHNIYFGAIGLEWTSCFEITKKLLKKFDVNVPIEESLPPFCLSTSFWARTDSLEKLLNYNWKYEDFDPEPLPADGTISHALERSISYFAQEKKYYSGWCLSKDFSSLEIANLNKMLEEIVSTQQLKLPKDLSYSLRDHINRLNLLSYPEFYKRKYRIKVGDCKYPYLAVFRDKCHDFGFIHACLYSIKYVIKKILRIKKEK